MGIASWFTAPEINPINKKARNIPYFNPINKYGRTLWFSTFGFMIAFLSWYAFSPLLYVSIKHDLNLSQAEVANSNVLALTATLLVRLCVGPLCDRFGPRLVFAGTLLVGAVPTFLAGTIHNAAGLYAIRFFIGILGGTFVPCQVWATGFFDKNCVGFANAIAGGIGNSGGGITYFIMPAVFNSLVNSRHLSPHVAWRVSYVVPGILICGMAALIIVFGEDTPTGKWADRGKIVGVDADHMNNGVIVDTAGNVLDAPHAPAALNSTSRHTSLSDEKKGDIEGARHESGQVDEINIATHEVIQKPTFKEAMAVVFSPQTLALATAYFTSFGSELAINSILGAYYLKNFPYLKQTGASNWAAMFGLLNIVTRPLGGLLADVLYRRTHSLWVKKLWIHGLCLLMGVFCLILGALDPHKHSVMIGLVALTAIPLEMANGANFALVPHVHPHANGILSGIIGGVGNFGGIIFAIVFRYNGVHYNKALLIIGGMMLGMNLAVIWIKPLPKNQIGGR